MKFAGEDACDRAVEDVCIILGDGVRDADPVKSSYSFGYGYPAARAVGEAYASKGIDQQNLVKLYFGIQRLGAVHGKPEDIEDCLSWARSSAVYSPLADGVALLYFTRSKMTQSGGKLYVVGRRWIWLR
jgi:hypothetical protein